MKFLKRLRFWAFGAPNSVRSNATLSKRKNQSFKRNGYTYKVRQNQTRGTYQYFCLESNTWLEDDIFLLWVYMNVLDWGPSYDPWVDDSVSNSEVLATENEELVEETLPFDNVDFDDTDTQPLVEPVPEVSQETKIEYEPVSSPSYESADSFSSSSSSSDYSSSDYSSSYSSSSYDSGGSSFSSDSGGSCGGCD